MNWDIKLFDCIRTVFDMDCLVVWAFIVKCSL